MVFSTNIQVEDVFLFSEVCGPMGEDVNKGECHGLVKAKVTLKEAAPQSLWNLETD